MVKILVSNLSKSIGHDAVLTDINISLESGIVTGLQGINGSGKTMLMRAVCGLIKPSEGTVLYDGQELGKELDFPPSAGVLLEHPAFLNHLSGLRNLMLLAEIKGLASKEDCIAALDRVGLDPNPKRPYRTYSLGMKQRLGIAAAFFEKPDLIVLDEPTNALDTSGVALVEQIISEEKQRGAAILVSCHDGDFLENVADQIYRMQNGCITGQE